LALGYFSGDGNLDLAGTFLDARPPRPCECLNAKATCDWATTHRGDVLVENLRVGDLWIGQASERLGTIVEIEDFDLTRRFWISTGAANPGPTTASAAIGN
jgi:hypothetical protein